MTLGLLPGDGAAGTLVGRVWRPALPDGTPAGPSVVSISGSGDAVFDVTGLAPTCADLMNLEDPVAALRAARSSPLSEPLDVIAGNSARGDCDPGVPRLLAPVDLQAIKAAGVTFVASLLERVIEERAEGDLHKAEKLRGDIGARIGADLSSVAPGSDVAGRLKETLPADGLWSQYLEVGIGPDAEIFTKSQPLSAVGYGAEIGIHPKSEWNNPEPEVVLVVNDRGEIVGATLGNDVNLRDFEGRSALLLGKAKDNNASCAIGPFIRLFDETFGLDDVRRADVHLSVSGQDGFELDAVSSMGEISRDPLDLVEQTFGGTHQYPDGVALFTGTMFAPVQDRDGPGRGFTHHIGDVVSISSPRLGTLTNSVNTCDEISPWTFGASELMRNLAARKLL